MSDKKYKHILLDMDGTCCESKQKITAEMKTALNRLCEGQKGDITIVSGAKREQIEWQLDGLKCTILAQAGNDSPLWQNKLNHGQKRAIYKHIVYLPIFKLADNFNDRGSQISWSFIGHTAPLELKNEFDPDHKIRQSILKQHPFKSKTLTVTIAGTTCLDYTRKDGTKGSNIKRWIKENKLNKKDCIYYGDALFKGGNDYSVRGVIKCVAVTSPADLLKKLK